MTSHDDWALSYRWKRSVQDSQNQSQWETGRNVTAQWSNIQNITYIIVPLLCVLLCTMATIINARILLCVKWIRRPLSPTLYISLSLALADTCSAILIGLGFIFNSLLPKGLDVDVDNDCLFLTLEAFRLSGILISTIHLLVLAGNHYFGILCPFRSMRWLTHTNLTIVVVFIWVAPTAYIFGYFGSFKNQGFQREDCHIE
ncbi:hypothetical protein RUM44_009493 [Polyplax serrata]|uniref:G-protein coupled receptors family 1 profile domain-containing protein n=1 Tax=Polyplax serrata TaxID=468196 RepID=A0ABR1ASU4_POLSC